MWETALLGLVGGLAISLSGLAKKESRDTFSWSKMLPTIVIGGAIGIIAGLTNQDYGTVADTAGIAGLTALVENFWKGIYRKVLVKSA
jgi:hypothetical protein